jgi:hypothetical protein
MLDLTEQTRVNDWMYLQTRGIFLDAAQTKEVHWEHGKGLYEKILEWTKTGEWTNVYKQLCVVTGGRLSIGEFYNRNFVIWGKNIPHLDIPMPKDPFWYNNNFKKTKPFWYNNN